MFITIDIKISFNGSKRMLQKIIATHMYLFCIQKKNIVKKNLI
jgi:hypothetical protein